MKFKKTVALTVAAAMICCIASIQFIGVSAEDTLQTGTVIFEDLLNTEALVKARISDNIYEPLIQSVNGADASYSFTYVNAGGKDPCMEVINNNGWYGSAGIKCDITSVVDALEDKTGNFTISADVRKSASYEAATPVIGFCVGDSETASDLGDYHSESFTTNDSGFTTVTYTGTLPDYSGSKLYFYIAPGKPGMRIRNVKLTTETALEAPGEGVAEVNDDFTQTPKGTDSIPSYYKLNYDGTESPYLEVNSSGSTKALLVRGLSGNLPDGSGILVNLSKATPGQKLKLSLRFGTGNTSTTVYMKIYNVIDGITDGTALTTSEGCSTQLNNSTNGTIDNFIFKVPEYQDSYMVYLSPYTGSTKGTNQFRLYNLYINQTDEADPSDGELIQLFGNEIYKEGAFSEYDDSNTDAEITVWDEFGIQIKHGNDWNENNGAKTDITNYIKNYSGRTFGLSVAITTWAWEGDNRINKAKAFFKVVSANGDERTVDICSGPDSTSEIDENVVTLSGRAVLSFESTDKIYLCFTHGAGQHQYKEISFSVADDGSTPIETPSATETTAPTETASATETIAPTETASATETTAPTETASATETTAPTETASATEPATPTDPPTTTEPNTPTDPPSTSKPIASFAIIGTKAVEGGAKITVSNTTNKTISIKIYATKYTNDILSSVKVTYVVIPANTGEQDYDFIAESGDTIYIWNDTQEAMCDKSILN